MLSTFIIYRKEEMFSYMTMFLLHFKPCFSRYATFQWFVVASVGFMIREDCFGVTSIIRALVLPPHLYETLLHFFHSTAVDLQDILRHWWRWVVQSGYAIRYNGNLVLLGDHTKNPKDGRKIPAVATLYQESETSSKPSYFRGHHWGCISMLTGRDKSIFSTPLWGQIHQPLNMEGFEEKQKPITIRMVAMALFVAKNIKEHCTLVLDAYFSVGPVFEKAYRDCKTVSLTILTRAKSNVVAYCDPENCKKGRGRPPIYGKKLKLFKKFHHWKKRFRVAYAIIYGKEEEIRYHAVKLLWRTLGRKLLFIMVETSRGKMILMCSDLDMDPIKAIELYCYRVKIETVFSIMKNMFGICGYHFWSSYLLPQSRMPKRNKKKRFSRNPEKTKRTFLAIETFFNIQVIVIGLLQLLCLKYTHEVANKAKTWLRTFNPVQPSEFMAKRAMSKEFLKHLHLWSKNPIMQIIQEKQKSRGMGENFAKLA